MDKFASKLGISDQDEIFSLKEFFDKKTKVRKMVFPENIAEFYEIKVTFACILLKIPMKKMFGYPFVKKTYTSFYDVIYNYSFRKVEKLFELKGFRIIFNHFNEMGHMEQMINEDPTMSWNPESYRKGIQTLFKIAQKVSELS